MKVSGSASWLTDPKRQRSCIFSLLPALSLLCLIFFFGSAFLASDYSEKFSTWGTVESLETPNITKWEMERLEIPKISKCENRCRPYGSESLPEGIVSRASNLEMQPLWGRPKRAYKKRIYKSTNLFAMAVGIKQKDLVDKMVTKFLSCDFAVILFHYDNIVDEWTEFEWSDSVIHVSAFNQTKWWFAKRFLHPDIVEEYNYIFLWDEDLGVDGFNPNRYISIIKGEGLEISQPALDSTKSEVHHQITARGRRSQVHRRTYRPGGGPRGCDDNSTTPPCTGWIEIMAPVFTRAAWRCVWYMIQNDLVHAWGLDMRLGYCAQGDRMKNIGVVDTEYIIHYGRPSLGGPEEPELSPESRLKDHRIDLSPESPPKDHRIDVRRQSYIEFHIFRDRWIKAVKDDVCWTDPYPEPVMEYLP